MSEIDEPARPQYLAIDAMKIQLMTNLNLMMLEAKIFKDSRRSLTHNIKVDKKTDEAEVTKFIVSINERLDYLLEIATNVFVNPEDPDRLEFKRFEDMANRMVRQAMLKPKYWGLKKKKL